MRIRVRVRVRVSASLPPAERVSATHMFTVVGSADMASRPARSVAEILAPSSVVTDHMIAGSTARLTPWIAACSRTRNAAAASSDVGSVRPDRKKMPHVAPHATVSSGRKKPATARARMDALLGGRRMDVRWMEWRTSRAAYGGRDRGHRHSRGSAYQKVAPVQETSHSPKRTHRGGVVTTTPQQRNRRAANLYGCPTQLVWRAQQCSRR